VAALAQAGAVGGGMGLRGWRAQCGTARRRGSAQGSAAGGATRWEADGGSAGQCVGGPRGAQVRLGGGA
jgi:hypothetical protein